MEKTKDGVCGICRISNLSQPEKASGDLVTKVTLEFTTTESDIIKPLSDIRKTESNIQVAFVLLQPDLPMRTHGDPKGRDEKKDEAKEGLKKISKGIKDKTKEKKKGKEKVNTKDKKTEKEAGRKAKELLDKK